MSINFKVAVCGPHGSGKSTLVGQIIECLTPPPSESWTAISDLARECPHRVGSVSNSSAQRWILDRRKEMDALSGLIVSDGCMLNDCAYYLHWAGKQPADLADALDLARTYDVLVVLPADPRLCIDDGLRPQSLKFLSDIQDYQSSLLAQLNAPLWRLPTYDQYDRTAFLKGPLRAIYRDKVLRQRMVALAFVFHHDRLLIVRRPIKGTPEADGLWDVIAGNVEFGETPAETCIRELLEEMGLHIRIVEQFGPVATRTWLTSGAGQFQALTVAFRCELIGQSVPTPCTREVADWQWLSLEELKTFHIVPSLPPYIEVLQHG